jgi:hypothetical protein
VVDEHPVSCDRDQVSVHGFRLEWFEHLEDEVEVEHQDSGHRSKFAGLKELLAGKTATDLLVSLFAEIRELQ